MSARYTVYSVTLTPRELETLRLYNTGKTYREIMQTMTVSFHTVKQHLWECCNKLGAANSREACFLARQQGLVHDQEPV